MKDILLKDFFNTHAILQQLTKSRRFPLVRPLPRNRNRARKGCEGIEKDQVPVRIRKRYPSQIDAAPAGRPRA